MFSQQMLATVVGWDLYLSTRSPVVLGNVGLVQIIPVLLFTFVAGHVADRYNRSRTAMVTQMAQALVAFVLASGGKRARRRADLRLPVSHRHGARVSMAGDVGHASADGPP